MFTFKLEPADILANVNDRIDPFSAAKRWLLGPYDHVFVYLGQMNIVVAGKIIRHPMLFESNGRGVVIQSLSNRYGQEVVVMRLRSNGDRQKIPHVIEQAVALASDPQAFYDYQCIIQHVLPQLICQKLGLPIPLKYQRNRIMICSEAAAEIFWRAMIEIVPRDIVPLPSSFVESVLLLKAWRGKLSPEVVRS
jgi:hypothetical protein